MMGCNIAVDHVSYRFVVERDLRGTAEIRADNVHATGEGDSVTKELKEYCEKEAPDYVAFFSREFGLSEYEIQKTELPNGGCDISMTGKFGHFDQIMVWVGSDDGYDLRKYGDTFEAHLSPLKSDAGGEWQLSILYHGLVPRHNAERLEDDGTLTWSGNYLHKNGLHLEFDLSDAGTAEEIVNE